MGYLTEYNRLAGIGPSFQERAANPESFGTGPSFIDVLSKAFSTKVKLADVKFLQYRKSGKGVELEDRAARLGGILTSVESREADPRELMAWLKQHGAKSFKVVESVEDAYLIQKNITKMGMDYAAYLVKHKITSFKTEEAIEEAKRKTFKASRAAVLDYLKKQHWDLVLMNRSMKPMKVPHATSPDGRIRLWFKTQAVYVTEAPKGHHELGDARSSWVDIRSMSPAEFIKDIEDSARKPVKSYW